MINGSTREAVTVEAGIAKNWKDSGNNTTGASTRIPVSTLIGKLKEFAPVKRLALLYTPGEKGGKVSSTAIFLKNVTKIIE
jgi:ABC-type uncharacterized transport system substrate-binding protein